MTQAPRLGPAGRIVLRTFLGGGLVLLLLAGWLGWLQWQRYEAALDAATPRIARLQGIALSHAELAQALEAGRATLAQFAYPASLESSRAAAELEARVREAFVGAGVNIIGSQQMPARAGSGYEEIVLSLSVQGDLAQILHGLRSLDGLVPKLRIEQLRLQPMDIHRPDAQSVNAQLRVVALRLQGP